MICISIFVQINRNWSKRTESRMNVAPSPSQETVALLLCEFNIHVKLTHVIHGDHPLSTKDLQMRTSGSLFAQCVASQYGPSDYLQQSRFSHNGCICWAFPQSVEMCCMALTKALDTD